LNFLNFNLKKAFLLLMIFILPLISINMEHKRSTTVWFAQPLSFTAEMFQTLFSSLSLGVRGTVSEYINLLDIKAENADLKNKMSELSTRLKLFEENLIELERLKNLIDFQKNTKMQLIPAQVIARDLLPDHKTITINKGTHHGLKNMQAVLTVSGAVGYVFRPEKFTSHILLITDRYSVVDALIQKTRSHGIVEGQGENSGVLQYVDRTDEVKAGDLIVTGGLDNIFPKGFPLGVVTEVARKTQSASFAIQIRPVVESEKIEEVFVVQNAAGESFFKNTDEINVK
jgi:rod shape-determining protein MreC